MAVVVSGLVSVRVRASWDTQSKTKNNIITSTPNLDPSVKKINFNKLLPQFPPTTTTPISINTLELLKRNPIAPKQEKVDDKEYMGFERWLPAAPKVTKPRSIYNAASLAYIGDCIYECLGKVGTPLLKGVPGERLRLVGAFERKP
ncbi:hypothetical protein GIB67_026371 [Kingdonia uniflora]|uniref:RNase III domain-containing protein n=1 Tax=Kingdonia uniflora TaxID=39325 RepID=A0A7J7P6E1_9MAGN|nr:hypothetical protein GIB67_026371 [Kingdonia uniflora]